MNPFKRLYAFLGGYYALPCPSCGREAYGFEAGPGTRTVMVDGHALMVCPQCTKEGRGDHWQEQAQAWAISQIAAMTSKKLP